VQSFNRYLGAKRKFAPLVIDVIDECTPFDVAVRFSFVAVRFSFVAVRFSF